MGDVGFAQLVVTKKSGTERFEQNGRPLDGTLLDFWRWSASDLVSNTTRGILAEYIVANALGLEGTIRAEWDAYDLLTQECVKIEIKSASYLQSWYHKKLSPIRFSIGPSRAWEAGTNESATEVQRQADIYIFCLLKHRDKDTLNPLELDQWAFYLLRTSVLDENCRTQKTISLGRLLQLKPRLAQYHEIEEGLQELTRESTGLTYG